MLWQWEQAEDLKEMKPAPYTHTHTHWKSGERIAFSTNGHLDPDP